MLYRATALTALCALSGLKTSVSSSVRGNKDIPSEHHNANKADRDTSSSAYNDPFVPRTIVNGRLHSSRAPHTINDHFPKNVEGINSFESLSPATRQTSLLVNEEHQDTIPVIEHTHGRDDYSPTTSQTRMFDIRNELGILDPGHQPIRAMDEGSDNRRLQDTTAPIELQITSCSDYCSGYGERPLIDTSVYSFESQVYRFLREGGNGPINSFLNGPINCWNTSLVTDMSYAFSFKSYTGSFNSPLNCWDTSAVTTMERMFFGQDGNFVRFNQPVNSWDTSAVTSMRSMFLLARSFNQPVDSWNTSAVSNMSSMFRGAYEFNQPVDSWNTSAVTDMNIMFGKAESFNQPVDSWDTSAVTDMSRMFEYAEAFNQCISTWAGKTPDNFREFGTVGMLKDSGCSDTSDPNPNQGPWCCVPLTESPSGAPSGAPSDAPSSAPAADPCAEKICKKCFGKKASQQQKCRVYVAPGETTSTCISKDRCIGRPGTCYKRGRIVRNKKGKLSPVNACRKITNGKSPLLNPPTPLPTNSPTSPRSVTDAPTRPFTRPPVTIAPTNAPTNAPTPLPTNSPTSPRSITDSPTRPSTRPPQPSCSSKKSKKYKKDKKGKGGCGKGGKKDKSGSSGSGGSSPTVSPREPSSTSSSKSSKSKGGNKG